MDCYLYSSYRSYNEFKEIISLKDTETDDYTHIYLNRMILMVLFKYVLPMCRSPTVLVL